MESEHEAGNPCHLGAIDQTDKSGTKTPDGLNLDEFSKAMRKMVKEDVGNDETERLFKQIDVYCRGQVRWDEYLTYMLLEKKNRESIELAIKGTPLPTHATKLKSCHKYCIEKICFLSPRRSADLTSGQYATMGKSEVNLWDENFKLASNNRLIPYNGNTTRGLWVTDIEPVSNYNMLAVSTVEGDVFFVDVGVGYFGTTFVLTGLPHPVMCINYNHHSDLSYMVLGDSGGDVILFTFKFSADGLFGIRSNKEEAITKIKLSDILHEKLPYVKVRVYKRLHNGRVKQVKYVADQSGFFSCAVGATRPLIGVNTLRSQVFYQLDSVGGITCFDYNTSQQVIATGHVDGSVLIWNIHKTTRTPLMTLTADNSTVTQVYFCTLTEHVVALSGGCLRAWDLRRQQCHQEIHGTSLLSASRRVGTASKTLSSVMFNEQRQQLILAGGEHILLLRRAAANTTDGACEEPRAHRRAVTAALYSPVFDRLVTGCQDSEVRVWDAANGCPLLHFTHAHTWQTDKQVVVVGIASMRLDGSGRRLITGSRHGQLKLWNFNNGECLRVLETPTQQPLLAMTLAREQVICAGGGGSVIQFTDACSCGGDGAREGVVHEWPVEHSGAVVAVACRLPSTVVTAAADTGQLFVWTLQTGRLHRRLDCSRSINNNNNDDDDDDVTTKTSSSSIINDDRDVDITTNANAEQKATQVAEDANAQQDAIHAAMSKQPVETEIAGCTDNNAQSATIKCEMSTSCNSTASTPDITCVAMLVTRSHAADTASLLAACSTGRVLAWSLHHAGGLLHEFVAATSVGSAVTAMSVEPEERYLVTADCDGHVRVWMIADYWCGNSQPHVDWTSLVTQFPFLSLPRRRRRQHDDRHSPTLLTAFRAHMSAITCIDLSVSRRIVVTTGSDCTVRVWTMDGRQVGTLGQQQRWQLPPEQLARRLPADVRRHASSTSLKVFNAGAHPKWRAVRRALLVRAAKLRRENAQQQQQAHMRRATVAVVTTSWAGNDPAGQDGLHVGTLSTEVDSADAPVLGRYWCSQASKRSITRQMGTARFVHGQAMVYSLLPTSHVQDIAKFELPPALKQLHERGSKRTCHATARAGRKAVTSPQTQETDDNDELAESNMIA